MVGSRFLPQWKANAIGRCLRRQPSVIIALTVALLLTCGFADVTVVHSDHHDRHTGWHGLSNSDVEGGRERGRQGTVQSAMPSAAAIPIRSSLNGSTSGSRSSRRINEGNRSSLLSTDGLRSAGQGSIIDIRSNGNGGAVSTGGRSNSSSISGSALGSRRYDNRRSIRSRAAARRVRGRKRPFIGVDSPFKGLFTDGFVRPGATESVAMESYMYFPMCVNKTKKGNVFLTVASEDGLGVKWGGWGTTLARPGRYIGGLSNPDDRKSLLSLLFDPTVGLGLTRVRYMIPPGYDPTLSPGIYKSQDRDWSNYLPTPDTFNMSADWKQVRAVQEGIQVAAAAGRKLHVDAISLSPPWWMTVSKDVAGGEAGAQNVDASNITNYATFLLTLTQKFASDLGITFETLTAMNEPLEGWWKKGQVHPGCSFTFDGAKALYAELLAQKNTMGLNSVALAGVDSWWPSSQNLMTYTYGGNAPPFKYFTVHGYKSVAFSQIDSIESSLIALRTAAKKAGVRVWQTEWGPLGVTGTELEIAIFMGRSIIEHINILGASVWFHFLALQVMNNVQWGAMMQDMYASTPNPVITKQFYATLHYSRYITEGSRILKMQSSCKHGVVAAFTPDEYRLTVTAANQRNESFHIFVRFNGFHLHKLVKAAHVEHYVTNETLNHELVKSEKKRRLWRYVDLFIGPQSITTVIVYNVSSWNLK